LEQVHNNEDLPDWIVAMIAATVAFNTTLFAIWLILKLLYL
jgi:hypothetical protein